MSFGYYGGRRRHFRSDYRRHQLVRWLKPAVRRKCHKHVDVVSGDDGEGTSANLEVYAGDQDMGFLLPGTDSLTSTDRGSNEVYVRGLSLDMELCVSRSCSVRVLVWWSAAIRTHPVFRVTSNDDHDQGSATMVGHNFRAAGFGNISDTSSGVGFFASQTDNVPFSATDNRPHFFRALDSKKRANVVMDKVHHFNVGSSLHFHPLRLWLPVWRKLKGRDGQADGLYRIGRETLEEYNMHVMVLVHVPSFSAEQTIRGGVPSLVTDLWKMDTDPPLPAPSVASTSKGGGGQEKKPVDKRTEIPDSEDEEPSSRKRRRGGTFTFRSGMQPLSGIAEIAGGLTSNEPGVALPALEVRRMSTTIYWNEEGELFSRGQDGTTDSRFKNEWIEG